MYIKMGDMGPACYYQEFRIHARANLELISCTQLLGSYAC